MYTIRAVAEATGIPPATLRAWERRYAVVRPARSPAGYRLYDESLIQDLRVMRELVAVGHPASEAARVVAGRRQDAAAASPSPPISELIAAARSADPAAISAAVAAGLAAPLPVAVAGWLVPALTAVGEGWVDGTMGIATEHLISHAIHRALATRLHRYTATARGAPVLVGLPSGSHHELGALAFGALAARDALPVCYLGADLPAAAWVQCARQTRATAAVIAVPTRVDVATARGTTKALASVPAIRVFAGGAHQDDICETAAPLGHDIVTAVSVLRARLESRP